MVHIAVLYAVADGIRSKSYTRRAAISSDFAAELEERIVREYSTRGDALGWRLLYSHHSVLDSADLAFIGLNPGGGRAEPDHPTFARPENSSAYLDERWKGYPAGDEPLQRQVQSLFAYLGVAAPSVLAGNLVPFRSPSWDTLKDQRRALAFGLHLWRQILNRARPSLVIAMGKDTSARLRELLGVRDVASIPIGWGNVAALKGRFGSSYFVGLPHLSRFRIFGRVSSAPAVRTLFDDWLGSRG